MTGIPFHQIDKHTLETSVFMDPEMFLKLTILLLTDIITHH